MMQGFSFPHDMADLLLSCPSPNHHEAGLNWVFPLPSEQFPSQGRVGKADEECAVSEATLLPELLV